LETQVGAPLHVPHQSFEQVSPAQHFLFFEHVYLALEQIGAGFFVGLMVGLSPVHVPQPHLLFEHVSPAQHFRLLEHAYLALEQIEVGFFVGTGFFVGLMVGLDPMHLPHHVFEHLRPGQHFLAFEHIVLEQVEVGFFVGLMTGLDSAHE